MMQKRAYREKCGAKNKKKESVFSLAQPPFFFYPTVKKQKKQHKGSNSQRTNNGRGHISEAGAAPVQHQRAENKDGSVRAELTQAYIILGRENLSHS